MRVEGKKSQSGKVLGNKGETGWTDVGGPETVGRGGGPEEVNKEMSYRYKQQQVGSAERKVQGGDGLGW